MFLGSNGKNKSLHHIPRKSTYSAVVSGLKQNSMQIMLFVITSLHILLHENRIVQYNSLALHRWSSI